MASRRCCGIALTVIGALLLVILVVGGAYLIPSMLNTTVQGKIVVDGPSHESVKDGTYETSDPIVNAKYAVPGDYSPKYFSVYLFNLKNLNFLENPASASNKIEVEQKGPYTYQSYSTYFNVEWLDNYNQVKYNSWARLEFKKDVSEANGCEAPCNPEEQDITSFNLFYAGLMNSGEDGTYDALSGTVVSNLWGPLQDNLETSVRASLYTGLVAQYHDALVQLSYGGTLLSNVAPKALAYSSGDYLADVEGAAAGTLNTVLSGLKAANECDQSISVAEISAANACIASENTMTCCIKAMGYLLQNSPSQPLLDSWKATPNFGPLYTAMAAPEGCNSPLPDLNVILASGDLNKILACSSQVLGLYATLIGAGAMPADPAFSTCFPSEEGKKKIIVSLAQSFLAGAPDMSVEPACRVQALSALRAATAASPVARTQMAGSLASLATLLPFPVLREDDVQIIFDLSNEFSPFVIKDDGSGWGSAAGVPNSNPAAAVFPKGIFNYAPFASTYYAVPSSATQKSIKTWDDTVKLRLQNPVAVGLSVSGVSADAYDKITEIFDATRDTVEKKDRNNFFQTLFWPQARKLLFTEEGYYNYMSNLAYLQMSTLQFSKSLTPPVDSLFLSDAIKAAGSSLGLDADYFTLTGVIPEINAFLRRPGTQPNDITRGQAILLGQSVEGAIVADWNTLGYDVETVKVIYDNMMDSSKLRAALGSGIEAQTLLEKVLQGTLVGLFTNTFAAAKAQAPGGTPDGAIASSIIHGVDGGAPGFATLIGANCGVMAQDAMNLVKVTDGDLTNYNNVPLAIINEIAFSQVKEDAEKCVDAVQTLLNTVALPVAKQSYDLDPSPSVPQGGVKYRQPSDVVSYRTILGFTGSMKRMWYLLDAVLPSFFPTFSTTAPQGLTGVVGRKRMLVNLAFIKGFISGLNLPNYDSGNLRRVARDTVYNTIKQIASLYRGNNPTPDKVTLDMVKHGQPGYNFDIIMTKKASDYILGYQDPMRGLLGSCCMAGILTDDLYLSYLHSQWALNMKLQDEFSVHPIYFPIDPVDTTKVKSIAALTNEEKIKAAKDYASGPYGGNQYSVKYTGRDDINEVKHYAGFGYQNSYPTGYSDQYIPPGYFPFFQDKYSDNGLFAGQAPELRIRGSDGTQIAPMENPTLGATGPTIDSLRVFVHQVFRSVPLAYTGDVPVRGITTNQFSLGSNAFDVRENENTEYGLVRDGVFPLTYARGAPIYVSLPNYMHAESWVHQHFTGLEETTTQAQEDKYRTYLNVEPITGATFDARKRMQVNVALPSNVREFEKDTNGDVVKEGLGFYPELLKAPKDEGMMVAIPSYWFEERGTLTSKNADSYNSKVEGNLKIARALLITGAVLGALMIIAGVIMIVKPGGVEETVSRADLLAKGEVGNPVYME